MILPAYCMQARDRPGNITTGDDEYTDLGVFQINSLQNPEGLRIVEDQKIATEHRCINIVRASFYELHYI